VRSACRIVRKPSGWRAMISGDFSRPIRKMHKADNFVKSIKMIDLNFPLIYQLDQRETGAIQADFRPLLMIMTRD
jgi:hypothetical protein